MNNNCKSTSSIKQFRSKNSYNGEYQYHFIKEVYGAEYCCVYYNDINKFLLGLSRLSKLFKSKDGDHRLYRQNLINYLQKEYGRQLIFCSNENLNFERSCLKYLIDEITVSYCSSHNGWAIISDFIAGMKYGLEKLIDENVDYRYCADRNEFNKEEKIIKEIQKISTDNNVIIEFNIIYKPIKCNCNKIYELGDAYQYFNNTNE